MSDALFDTPLEATVRRAVSVALEAWDGEMGDSAEQAYKEQMDRSLAQSGMTEEEIDRFDSPRSWVGRMIERLQDWWWERTYEAVDADLETAFAFPVPLLQTKPLQETPFDYDEVDRRMAHAATEIAAAISGQTSWETVPFAEPDFDPEDFDFDPMEQVKGLWKKPNGEVFVLVDTLNEDPKIMGYTMGAVHLPADIAAMVLSRV